MSLHDSHEAMAQYTDGELPDYPDALTHWNDDGTELVAVDPDAHEIDSLLAADKAMSRLRRVRENAKNDREMVETRIAELTEFLDRQMTKHDKAAAWHEAQLFSWHRALLAKDPKRKTIDLPSGTLKAIAGRVSTVPDDEPAAVAWAQANGRDDLLNVKVTLSRSAVAKAFTAKPITEAENLTEGVYVSDDGEIVPGVKYVKPGVTYKADPS